MCVNNVSHFTAVSKRKISQFLKKAPKCFQTAIIIECQGIPVRIDPFLKTNDRVYALWVSREIDDKSKT